MKTILTAFFLLCAAMTAIRAEPASAFRIEEAWARATPAASRNGAFYFNLTNAGGDDDRLVRIDSVVAQKVELHESRMESGVMTMRPLEAVDVPAGATVSFAPGGKHVMLMGLKAPLVAGARFPVTFIFEKAGPVLSEVTVRAAGPAPAMGAMGGMSP